MKFKIILFLISCLLIFSFVTKSPKPLPKSAYLTEGKIYKYIESTLNILNQPSKKDFSKKTNEIGSILSSRLAILKSIDTIHDDPLLIRNGKYGFWKIIRKIKSANLKKHLAPVNNSQFTYRKGSRKEEQSNKNSFTVLSFNVCFLPDDMPLFFGGMLPWEKRIDKVTQFIETNDTDILCLQEVFDKGAQDALYKRLRNKYAHFYTDIGPSNFDGSLLSLGFGSGLFIASKYPLKNPEFNSFKNSNPHMNRGIFTFQPTKATGEVLGTIFTTHLEPFESGKEMRKKELEQIISQMQTAKKTAPIILCGDLNLPIKEAKKWINTYFEDHINVNQIKTNYKNFTSCDFTNHRLKINDKEIKPEYLDYFLFFKNKQNEKLKITTRIIKTFDHNNLDDAISDHHALFSNIEF